MLAQAPVLEARTQGVAVVGAIGEKDLAFAETGEHVGGAAPVMSLALRSASGDGQAVGVDHGMDFGRQPAPRTPHAAGSSEVPSGGCRLRAPLFPVRTMLVDPDRGTVDHLQVAVIGA